MALTYRRERVERYRDWLIERLSMCRQAQKDIVIQMGEESRHFQGLIDAYEESLAKLLEEFDVPANK